jgi:hypothetical protein
MDVIHFVGITLCTFIIDGYFRKDLIYFHLEFFFCFKSIFLKKLIFNFFSWFELIFFWYF